MSDPFAELSPPYSAVVVDPPWPYEDGPTGYQRQSGKRSYLAYTPMPVPEIAALPVASLGKVDAHLFLWTTQRFLESAFGVTRAWGFTPGPTLTWCKDPAGHQSGGAFAPSTEFVLVCRRNFGPAIRAAREAAGLSQADLHRLVRGNAPTGLVRLWELGTRYPNPDDWRGLAEVLGVEFDLAGPLSGATSTTWFRWPRGVHSAKPGAFYDLVQAIAPAPRVDLFARDQRLGWDSWGWGYELGESA